TTSALLAHEDTGLSNITSSAARDQGTRIIWKKKNAPKCSFRKTNEELLGLLTQWTRSGYFDEKRTSLEIYKKIITDGEITFRISELEKCLKILCSNRTSLLQKKSIDGILMYWKRLEHIQG